jgi:hypothetical protein
LTTRRDHLVCVHIWTELEKALGRVVECAWAGYGWPLHKPNEPMEATVERVMPDVDWVVIEFSRVIPKKRGFKVATRLSDMHGCQHLNLSPRGFVDYLNQGGWDAVLMMYTHLGGMDVPPDLYLKNLKAPIFHLSPCIDPEIYKPSNENKQFDVTFIGAVHSHVYPLRTDIAYKLPRLAAKRGWETLIGNRPPGGPFERDMERLHKLGYVVGPRYVEALQKTKVFIFGTSIYLYPLTKFCEAMSTGAMVMSNQPLTMDALHYVPDWNFVPINRRNWKQRLEYFVSHNEEREEIASNGLDTVLKYHTLDIRAKELARFLETHK